MGHHISCPNGCGEDIRAIYEFVDDEPTILVPRDRFHFETCRGSFESGTAVVFGLMGMAHAIRARLPRFCEECPFEEFVDDFEPGPILCRRCM